MSNDRGAERTSTEAFTLIYAVFVAGLCSIVYELLIATTVVYFLGDSVRWFSITIGLYMAAMGLGAYTSKFIKRDLLSVLIGAEVLLGLLGGFSVPMLYLAYAQTDAFLWIYGALTVAIGFLIGWEVPFLTRLLERYDTLRVSIAHVLSLDYLGALIATLAFPLLLLPFLGTFKSGLVLGLINMSIGLFLLWGCRKRVPIRFRVWFVSLSILVVVAILAALVMSRSVLALWNQSIYDARILHAERSLYQEIVLTRARGDLRLYLNGRLQFSSVDEHRYHEALVHVPFTVAEPVPEKMNILVLGGGDGLAVRELLRREDVGAVTLVDLDPAVLALARDNVWVKQLNDGAFSRSDKVRVIAGDAFGFLKQRQHLFHLILVDLPDPSNTDLARLYTREFYRLVRSNLRPGGTAVVQSSSPYFAKKAFWTIHDTLGAVFDHVRPYHVPVPSFGDWGFVLASDRDLRDVDGSKLPNNVRYLTQEVLPGLFIFPPDLQPGESGGISTLDQPIVLRHYLSGWRHWSR